MSFSRLTYLSVAVGVAATFVMGCAGQLESVHGDFRSTPYTMSPSQLTSVLGEGRVSKPLPDSNRIERHCFEPGTAARGGRCYTFVDGKMYSRITKHQLRGEAVIQRFRDFASTAQSGRHNERHNIVFTSPTKQCVVMTSPSGVKPSDKAATVIDGWSAPAAVAALNAGTLCANSSYGDDDVSTNTVFLRASEKDDGMYDISFVEITHDVGVVRAFTAERGAAIGRFKKKVDALRERLEALNDDE